MEQLTNQDSIIKEGKSYFQKYKSFDVKITKSLRSAEIQTRPADSNGIWCLVLLPAILINYNTLYNVPQEYSFATYISVGLFLYFALLIVFMSISSSVLKEYFHGGAVACSLTSTLLIYSLLKQDLFVSLILMVTAIVASGALFHSLLTRFPRTYTIGEAIIVAQGLTLFIAVALGRLTMNLGEVDREVGMVNTIVYTALATVTAIVASFSLVRQEARSTKNFLGVVGAFVVVAIAVLSYQLGLDFMLRFGSFLSKKSRVQIIISWLSLVAAAVGFVSYSVKSGARADTCTRKVFHALASAVFATGLLLDRPLMALAAGLGLAALIFVEAVRKFNLEPYSSTLQSAFELYADEKDMGGFAMTPMYLFVGLACPLVLVPEHPGFELELLSGVLAIGVGDSAASWVGSRYGTLKWPDSDRTVEGTASNIVSQIFVVYVLRITGLTTNSSLLRASVAAVISSLVEAGTSQVDNLILPLVSLLAFQATCFL